MLDGRYTRFPLFLCLVTPLALPACASSKPAPPAITAPPPVVSAAPPPEVDAAPSRPAWTAEYPATRTNDVVETRFGIEVHDPYRWLEEGTSPEVRQWMDAEAALARKHLDALPARPAIASRLHELYYVGQRHEPVRRGKRLFFEAQTAAQEKSVLYVRNAEGKEVVVLDPNTWPAKDNPSLQEWAPSRDGTKLAYAVSLHNGDEVTVHVLDLVAKHDTKDVLPDLNAPGMTWTPDGKGFYYRYLPPRVPGARESDRLGLVELRYHRLGSDAAHDAVVHEKTGDAKLWLDGFVSDDGHWLFAEIQHGGDVTETYFRDLRPGAKSPAQKGWVTLAGTDLGRRSVVAYRDHFYVTTNDGAPNWRVMFVDPRHPDRASWREIVSERKDARLSALSVAGEHLVLNYYKDVTSHLEVRTIDGNFLREIPLPDVGTSTTPQGEEDADDAYYTFSSFTYPPEIERVSIGGGTIDRWYRSEVKVDVSRFVTDQVFYTSKDGTRVPMFIVRPKSAKRDGSAPLLLDGYGGFDLTFGPEFTRGIIPWLEKGGIYVWTDLRGGGEYGEAWHEGGMRHKKQNVFDDFIAAAEYLVHEGYTTADKLAAMGGSNGGLLMGAVTTQRPDLFRVILCGAPLEDMVRFPLVGDGESWVSEYGDPTKEDDFRALYAYSPLHHVVAGTRYPSFLMLSPANDDRVDPMHARKFVAELQAASTGGPVLLRVEKDSGHLGADTRVSHVGYWADQLAFALSEIGAVGASMAAPAP